MSVRMRSTSGKGGSRRANHKVNLATLKEEGGVMRLRHKASRITGMYRGKVIESISKNTAKKEEKIKTKKIEAVKSNTNEETASIPNAPAKK